MRFGTKCNKMKIMYVEDDEQMSVVSKIMFLQTTHDFVVCESVKSAKNVIKSTSIDVIILDLRLPTEDGIKLLEYIDENRIRTTVFIYSGFLDKYADQLEYYKSAGIVSEVYQKSAGTFKDILKKIEELQIST